MSKAQIALVFLLDTSSSMSANASVYESSMREYLETLKDDPNADYKLILVEFDTNPRVVACGQNLKDFKLEQYNPRGFSTNVYDSVFKATDTADDWLKREANEGRLYKVLFVILTDGEHNHTYQAEFSGGMLSYCAHSIEDVREKLAEKERTGYWTLVYLGANQDAWAVAGSIGISSGFTYTANAKGIAMAGASLGYATRSYSAHVSAGNHVASENFWDEKKEEDDSTQKLDPNRLP